jgi:hypothetical protein
VKIYRIFGRGFSGVLLFAGTAAEQPAKVIAAIFNVCLIKEYFIQIICNKH